MADNEVRVLWCLIQSESTPFEVIAPVNASMNQLKKLVKEEGIDVTERDSILAKDMTLWKLNEPIPIKAGNRKLTERIRLLGDLSQFAVELDPSDLVLELYPERPCAKHLHVIVQVPPAKEISLGKRHRMGSPPPNPPLDAIKRIETVSALYDKLNRYRFIQVRGTPASGKSTLAKLLGKHIADREPLVHVIWVSGWKFNDVEASGGWYPYLKKRKFWEEGKDTVFIFDEAQVSYADGALWNDLFKCMSQYRDRRAIAFASYGSPSSIISIEGTPIFIPDEARVTLLPIDHGDNLPAVGLFFTRTEFDELVSTHFSSPEYHFHLSFLDAVFGITEGHAGAICDVLAIILGYDSYRGLKFSGELYTWELFQKTVSLPAFLKHFEHPDAGVFRRGLPSDGDLMVVAVAGVFSSVLRTGFVIDTDFTTADDTSALQQCFRKGWLHSDKLDDEIVYFFPSSLHRWYVEWKLWGIVDTISFHAVDIMQFVMGVISIFSPRMLSTSRRIGPGRVQRPPEAQYQDEFYRCCHTHSNGSLVTFPEFGTAKGRVDFYIPAKEWGVELLRDGDKLAQHSGRFSSQAGSYGTTLRLSDYIILDCRTTLPRVPHPHLPKLHHVVFSNSFRRVQILDNMLNVVPRGEFVLLASS